jgi:hypothetical protein
MAHHIAVGMAQKSPLKGDKHTPKDESAPLNKRMDIVS